ncbi:hypothetical protein QSJ18_12490 [Gordonia sp. ABSL1-1]|uniref:hypothetical protein n=1 Tax=Gordonia sp. ABSL1-1 TaxID=3053923 RepID=UPI002572D695|nr:hypothetical protein [Gordonia sp. ABSL1-1]MDL9937566.1 hypothetical protein [Gordonia sp. ABSL1-1]
MNEPCEYEFIVDGAVSDRVLLLFPELTARVDVRHSSTRLTGELTDIAAARGVIARIESLGLTLLSFRRYP